MPPLLELDNPMRGELTPVEIPNLMAEYSEAQISLYGVSGTPVELLRMCPVPHDKMTLEAKNMFLVMAMNESSMAVKEEHLPYFREVAEARGVELKVTVRQEPEVTLRPVLKPERPTIHNTDKNEMSPDIPMAKLIRHDFIPAEDVVTPKDILKPQGVQSPEHKAVLAADEDTAVQMDEWLTQLQKEVESRIQTEISEQTPSRENEGTKLKAKSPLKIIPLPNTVQPPRQHNRRKPAVSVTRSPQSLMVKQNKLVKPAIKIDELPEEHKLVAETVTAPAFIEDHSLEPIKIITSTEARSLPNFAEQDTSLTQNIINDTPFQDLGAASSANDGIENEFQETAEIEQFFGDLNENTPAVAPLLLDQVIEYAKRFDSPETADELSALTTEIEAVTEVLVDLYASSTHYAVEDIQLVENQLEESCVVLFERLGIQPDEPLLRGFVYTLIQQQMPEGAQKIHFPLEEGTHEHKTFAMLKLMFTTPVKMPSLKLLGRFALWPYAYILIKV